MESTRLLLCCDNRVGILRDTTQMLASLGYSIGASCSEEGVFTNKFFFRAEFVPTENSKNSREDLEAAMQNLSRKMLNPYYRISYPNQKKRVSILTGKTTHCLDELLRLRDSLNFDLVNVIGNSSNRENKLTCARYDVPFTYVPSNATERKENEMLEYIKGSDFLITARYMLKFSKEFIESYGKAIINIHHGRIPGTEGQSNPYKNAF